VFNVINLLRKLWCNASLYVVDSMFDAFLQNKLLLVVSFHTHLIKINYMCINSLKEFIDFST